MRTVVVLDLSAPQQLNFTTHQFMAESGGLDLEKCHRELRRRPASYDKDGHFTTAGFLRPEMFEDNVSAIFIYEKKVGKFSETVFDTRAERLSVQEHDDTYFKQAVVQFRPHMLVAFVDGVSDRGTVRTTLQGIVQEWGFEARPAKLDPQRLHDLAHQYTSLSMTIDHIEIDSDGTRRVKFDVDPARGAESKVQFLYEGLGDISQLKVIIAYENQGYWVKIYPDGVLALDDDNLSLDKVEAYAFHVIRQVFGPIEG